MDADTRDLEKRARQNGTVTDITAWLVALIRSGRPLPIRLGAWWANVRIYKSSMAVGKWCTTNCKHYHPSRHNARACAKRARYQAFKEAIERTLSANEDIQRSTYRLLLNI